MGVQLLQRCPATARGWIPVEVWESHSSLQVPGRFGLVLIRLLSNDKTVDGLLLEFFSLNIIFQKFSVSRVAHLFVFLPPPSRRRFILLDLLQRGGGEASEHFRASRGQQRCHPGVFQRCSDPIVSVQPFPGGGIDRFCSIERQRSNRAAQLAMYSNHCSQVLNQ